MKKYGIKGKYNIGDKVLIEAQIIGIKPGKDEVVYTLDRDDWTHHIHIKESDIKKHI